MSLRGAINGMCRSCIYDGAAPGNWRQQVTQCPCLDCPLYPVRPVSKPEKRAKTGPESTIGGSP